MATTRQDVSNALAVHDPAELRAILEAARVATMGAETARELADRIADALWWHYSTPVGYLANRASLEDIVRHVTRKLGLKRQVAGDDAWEMLRDLTVALAISSDGGVALDDIDPAVRQRVWPSWMPTAIFATGATGSAGAGVVSYYVLKFAQTPIGKLLPYIPKIGPVFRVIKTGAGVASVVSGPLALAMGVLTVNQALGTSYRKLLPLLLGVGALGPSGIEDAVEVGAPDDLYVVD